MATSTAWKSIVVAVRDPSARKQLAVQKAARIAARSGAKLTLFHAFSTPYPVPRALPMDSAGILAAIEKERRHQLQAIAKPLRATGLKVHCEVAWDFPPAEAVVRHVLATRPDLLVAESHRHSTVARWFLANTDWELIRECPCPVWFVKSPRFAKRPLFLVAVDPTHARAKPSRLDDRLLAAATAAVAGTDGKLAVVHAEDVLRALPPGLLTGMIVPDVLQSEVDRTRAGTRRALDRLAARHGVADAERILRAGLPADVITATAEQLGADVMVMGVVSRSGLQRPFVGNTAEAVLDGVACDLLAIKPHGFKTSVPRRRAKVAAVIY
jgi:universal stress protein E